MSPALRGNRARAFRVPAAPGNIWMEGGRERGRERERKREGGREREEVSCMMHCITHHQHLSCLVGEINS